MKCKRYHNKLDDTKNWFLEELEEDNYNELTVKSFETFFHRVRDFELNILDGKLIQDFNFAEYEWFLKSLSSRSPESLSTYFNMIKRYRLFCIDKNIIEDTIDFTKNIRYENLLACLDTVKSKSKYITRKELDETLTKFINYQDQALYLLIFEGIRGVDNSEIINLKISDIDFENNEVTIRNKSDKLITRKISDKLADILERCAEQTHYYCDNEINDNVDTLIQNDYVLRPSTRYLNIPCVQESIENETYNGDSITKTTITNRFHKLTKQYSDTPFLTQTTLYRSGLMSRVVEKYGVDATKNEFANYCLEEEGFSMGMSYKLYNAFLEVVGKIKAEERAIKQAELKKLKEKNK